MTPLVAVDVRTVEGQFTGIGRYAMSLVPLLVAARPDWRFHLFVSPGAQRLFAELAESVTIELAPPVPNHPASDWWLHATLPRWLARNRAHVYFSAANYLPVFAGGARRVVTIHDLVPYRFPGLDPLKFVLYLRANLRLCAWIADAIVAVSHSTGREVEGILGVARERIHVVPNGVPAFFRRLPAVELADRIAARPELADLPRRFVLSVGTHTPRKNFARLIAAMARVRGDVALVLAGPSGQARASAEAHARSLGVSGRVRFVDYPDDDGLLALYNLAALFVYPSLYEGFGIPVLEAMACGTPVACSDNSSIPEVAGEAGVLFDATSEAAMAAAIDRVLADEALSSRLSAAGPPRAGRFTWESAAESTARVLETQL